MTRHERDVAVADAFLRVQLAQARCHLETALLQVTDSDDKSIVKHMCKALEILRELRRIEKEEA